MKLDAMFLQAKKVLARNAGTDGELTRAEAARLPKYMKACVESVRTGSQKVGVDAALSAVRWGGPNGKPAGLQAEWIKAQTDANGAVKTPTVISQTELDNITSTPIRQVTDLLWNAAETAPPSLNGVDLNDMTVAKFNAAAKVLTSLVKDLDNGDGLMRDHEIENADITYQGMVDAVTTKTLVTAANRASNAGALTVDEVIAQIEKARLEVLKNNTSATTKLTTDEQKASTTLGKQLIMFANVHQGHTRGDFDFTAEAIYVPSRPFRAPRNGTADDFVTAVVNHFDAFSNDNKIPGSRTPARIVMAEVEAAAVAKEIGKLAPAFAKQVLKALEARVQLPNALSDPPRVFFTAEAVDELKKVAKKFHVACDFEGDPRPPHFDFY